VDINDFSAKDTIQKACPLYLSSKFVKRHWKPTEKRGKEKGNVWGGGIQNKKRIAKEKR
jgi:hypothetical protein